VKEEVSGVTQENILLSLHSILVPNWTFFVLCGRLLLKSMKFRRLFHSRLRVIGSHFDLFILDFHIIYYIDILFVNYLLQRPICVLHSFTISCVK
jgi:hypothetical protein